MTSQKLNFQAYEDCLIITGNLNCEILCLGAILRQQGYQDVRTNVLLKYDRFVIILHPNLC